MYARLVRALPLALLCAACERSSPAAVGDAQLLPGSTLAAADGAPPDGVNGAAVNRLPAAFPRDIPIPTGLVAQSVQSEHAGSYMALFTGDLDPDSVHRTFEQQLVAQGWTIDKTRGDGPEYGLFAEKGDRIATVIATRIDGKLHVELGVYGGD